MSRAKGPPTPEEVRCPDCAQIRWRRLGERVVESISADDGHGLRLLPAERGPFDWTCDGCGYAVRPTGRLDNSLSRVQRRRRWGILAPLAGLLSTDPSRAPRPAQLATFGTTAAIAVVIAAVVGSGAIHSTAPSAPGPTSSVGLGLVEGQRVEFDAAKVTRVVGDTAFWIGPGDPVLVVIDEAHQPEQAVTVRDGQTVRISGVARRTAPGDVGVSAADRQAIDSVEMFILAESVEITDDP